MFVVTYSKTLLILSSYIRVAYYEFSEKLPDNPCFFCIKLWYGTNRYYSPSPSKKTITLPLHFKSPFQFTFYVDIFFVGFLKLLDLRLSQTLN